VAIFESDRVIALDIGASKLVLAEFGVAGGELELLSYGIERLSGDLGTESDQLAYIAANVRALMREHGIKYAPMIMCVSGQAVFPRYVKLPPVSRDKIAQMIQYEAEQNVPFPIKEVVWDYQLLGGEDGEQNVMLVAVKIENVRRLTDAVQAADLEPEIVDVAPMALYNTVRYNYPELVGCTMVLDIGARSSNLIFIEGARIFSRSIPVAGNAITQEIMKSFGVSHDEAEALKREHGFVAFGGVYAGAEDETADRISKVMRNVLTRLHAEVNRSINFYRSQQGGAPPATVLLCGGSSVIPHADTFFKEKLGVEVEYLNPFANVVVGSSIDADRINRDLHLLGEVVGLGLRRALTCPVEINLMPPDLVARKVFRRRLPYFVVAGLAVVLAMICGWAYFYRMGHVIDERIDVVRGQIKKFQKIEQRLSAAASERASAEARLSALAAPVMRRGTWLGLIDAVHACMWQGMWVTGWQPVVDDGGIGRIRLTMHAFVDRMQNTSEGTATERFRNALRARPEFTDATDIESEMEVGTGGFMRRFVLSLVLTEPVGAKRQSAGRP
jgi:type IV pilus assembly protein PilM